MNVIEETLRFIAIVAVAGVCGFLVLALGCAFLSKPPRTF